MSTLIHQLMSYRPFTAMVIGDFMLDQHIYGAAERLSPDAPVPVLHATRWEDTPGGAAHVARCLRALKATTRCYGVVGNDVAGETLRRSLREAGCEVDGISMDERRPTTIKRSMIGLAQHRHPQKMFRVDVESKEPLPDADQAALLARIEHDLDSTDVVCLEDYNKGVVTPEFCQQLIEICRRRGKPILVDPAAIEDYTKYRGATAITPNRTEAELATGLGTPIDASPEHISGLARRLLDELDLEAVVLTLDQRGALFQERGGEAHIVPTQARYVYDVTGAGDMVLAALAAAIANGLTWQDAVMFANAAAGLEVEAFGVTPIPFAAVRREILLRHGNLDGKVRTMNELMIELIVHREANQKIVFTNGCFDVLHAGHVAYLREARSLGDLLVVAINSDAQVQSLKGEGRPIYSEAERLEVLSELQSVDYLTVFDEATAHGLIERIQPDIYVKGGDYRPEEINEYDLVQKLGLELQVLAHRPGLSSTAAIERIARAGNTPVVETPVVETVGRPRDVPSVRPRP